MAVRPFGGERPLTAIGGGDILRLLGLLLADRG
jgi:hypothetical protein